MASGAGPGSLPPLDMPPSSAPGCRQGAYIPWRGPVLVLTSRKRVQRQPGAQGQEWACPAAKARAASRHWTCPAPRARTGHNPQMSTARLEKWACPRREGFKNGHVPGQVDRASDNGHVRWSGQPRLHVRRRAWRGPPRTGHVPRPGPGLGTIHKCPRPGSKNGHVPGGRASKMGMSGGPGNRGACPAPGHGAGLPALDMSRARGQDWAQSTNVHGPARKMGMSPEGGLQKWACPPGAHKKVAAPEGTATFKLQTAWPQGADSLRNTGN